MSSNINQVMAWINGFVDSFDFNRVGADQSLGRDVAMKVVENIHERCEQQPPGGVDGEWDENAPDYARWKEKRYGISDGPNTRTGQMLSQKSLYGRTRIAPKEITMVYGTNQPPSGTKTGVEMTEADKKVTDSQKAYYAHTGQGPHGTIRPFYQVNEADGKAVSELCQENLNDMIREENAKNGY